MEIRAVDHLVITTKDLAQCLAFYTGVLGMRHEAVHGRHSLHFGRQKINIHTYPGEFQPAATAPTAGSLDLCLLVSGEIGAVQKELQAKGCPIAAGVVERHGAAGVLDSVYVYDPDGNLVELAVPRRTAEAESGKERKNDY